MCYSKEVQLITSLIILVSALIYYFYYSKKYSDSKKKWLTPFLKSSLLVFLCIGLHQFCEFLALLTNNQIIYKIGLIISILSAYFLLRSLEILANKKMYSWIALVIISFIALHIIFAPMNFEVASFYLKHNSAFFWAAAWLFLFIYWNLCAAKIYSEIKDDQSRKTLLIYLLTIADVSFILSVIYVIAGYFLFSVNVCTDAPSIWCTFSVIQAFLVPILFFRLPKAFKRNKAKKMKIKQVIIYFLISLIILISLVFMSSLFRCLTWRFVFP